MKKLLLIGSVSCGKTTLCQALNGLKREYRKTQALEVVNRTIDTPGEYLEHRSYLGNLLVTATGTDIVLFLLDPTQERYMYSPGQAAAFMLPVAGVVTKADIATEKQVAFGRELLALAGADPIFTVSAVTGEGMDKLIAFLADEEKGE